jgi:hypothetical protein
VKEVYLFCIFLTANITRFSVNGVYASILVTEYYAGNAKIKEKQCSTYRPNWGPTLPFSKEELAVISSSRITPDSIPRGAMHWAEIQGNEGYRNVLKIVNVAQ